jgi:ABC-type lipoprotein export system ATPase subunit
MLLRLENVTRTFATADGAAPLPVLRGASLELDAAQTLAIVGPSGCGKSTLLNIIGTLERPDTGHVELGRRDLSKLNEIELAAVRNRGIGFIFQQHHLLPQCTVLENVLVPTLARVGQASRLSHSRREDGKSETGATPVLRETPSTRAERLLKRVGLGERLSHRPGQLSGGERQRVAVVRALINQPKLLLADEPTGSLDRASAADLGKLLLELNREESVALIVVTHALDLAQQMGRVMELKDGVLKKLEDGG